MSEVPLYPPTKSDPLSTPTPDSDDHELMNFHDRQIPRSLSLEGETCNLAWQVSAASALRTLLPPPIEWRGTPTPTRLSCTNLTTCILPLTVHPHTRFRRPVHFPLQRQAAFAPLNATSRSSPPATRRVEGNSDSAPPRRAARLVQGFQAPILRVAANKSESPSRKQRLIQGLQAPILQVAANEPSRKQGASPRRSLVVRERSSSLYELATGESESPSRKQQLVKELQGLQAPIFRKSEFLDASALERSGSSVLSTPRTLNPAP